MSFRILNRLWYDSQLLGQSAMAQIVLRPEGSQLSGLNESVRDHGAMSLHGLAVPWLGEETSQGGAEGGGVELRLVELNGTAEVSDATEDGCLVEVEWDAEERDAEVHGLHHAVDSAVGDHGDGLGVVEDGLEREPRHDSDVGMLLHLLDPTLVPPQHPVRGQTGKGRGTSSGMSERTKWYLEKQLMKACIKSGGMLTESEAVLRLITTTPASAPSRNTPSFCNIGSCANGEEK